MFIKSVMLFYGYHLVALFGLTKCMNHFASESFCHIFATGPGNSKEHPVWWDWNGLCVMCCGRIPKMQGIFCVNYCYSRQGWPPCRQAWHSKCYTSLDQGKYPIKDGMGEGEATWRPATDKVAEFSTGAKCVHFILPFQCEICWMRNLD